jgi:hypothetical protein
MNVSHWGWETVKVYIRLKYVEIHYSPPCDVKLDNPIDSDNIKYRMKLLSLIFRALARLSLFLLQYSDFKKK